MAGFSVCALALCAASIVGCASAPLASRPLSKSGLPQNVAIYGSAHWFCPFPAEADADRIDQAVVTLQVTVNSDGSARSVTVTSDPGSGFGDAARACALRHLYLAARDQNGESVLASAPLIMRFKR